ncbi:MAG: YbaK/EbsC family protein [Candidatus Kerfeldbacteria bacterium]|nr:YbaK/EbsC family protein [Candidatus Kerfeldbacteria bacterium]
MSLPVKVSNYLTKSAAVFEPVEHRTVFTAYDLAATLREPLDAIGKTLLVKTDKGFHLIVLPASRRLDLGKLKKLLGAKKITIATEKDMVRELKVKPGAITPFGSLHKLPVVVDKSLVKSKKILLGSGSFTDSVRMSSSVFVALENATLGAFSEAAGLKLPKPAAKKPLKKRPSKGARRTNVAKRAKAKTKRR